MKSTEGIRGLSNLQVGLPELSEVQLRVSERQRRGLRAELGANLPALLIGPRAAGGLDVAWQVHDDNDDGTITVRAGGGETDSAATAFMVTADGDVVEYEAGEAVNTSGAFITGLTVPDDNTWYTIVARAVVTTYGPGTIGLTTGSKALAGTGTRFTEHAGKTTDGFGRGTRIRIAAGDSTNGNAGTYQIDTITDDDTAQLVTNALGTSETGMRYRFAGNFLTSAPADPDCYRRLVPEFSRVARTREPAAGYVVLADVRRNSANTPQVDVVDRRAQHVRRAVRAPATVPAFSPRLVPDGTDPQIVQRELSDLLSGSYRRVHDVATCEDGGLLLLASTAANNLVAVKWVPKTGWGSPVTVTSGATNLGVGAAICRLPSGTGWTHRVVYRDNAVAQTRTTADDGATWGSASTIWTPASADASDTIAGEGRLVLLRNGRLVYADRYHDHSVSTTTTEHAIHFIWSDDYGATWSTNGNGGTLLLPMDGGNHFARPEVVQVADGRIWTLAFELSSSAADLVYVRSEDTTTPTPDSAASDYQTITAIGGGTSPTGLCVADVNPSGVISVWTVKDVSTANYTRIVQLRRDPDNALRLAVLNVESSWFIAGAAGVSISGGAGVRDAAGLWRWFVSLDNTVGDDNLYETGHRVIEQPVT